MQYSNNTSIPCALRLCLKFPKLNLNLLITAVLRCCSPPAERRRLWGPQFLPIILSPLSPLPQVNRPKPDWRLFIACFFMARGVSEWVSLLLCREKEDSTRLHARCSTPGPGSVTARLNLINMCFYWSSPHSCMLEFFPHPGFLLLVLSVKAKCKLSLILVLWKKLCCRWIHVECNRIYHSLHCKKPVRWAVVWCSVHTSSSLMTEKWKWNFDWLTNLLIKQLVCFVHDSYRVVL